MKSLKYIFIAAALISTVACEDFLKEEGYHDITGATLATTEAGMESMINSCYSCLRLWYGKEESVLLTEVGTDTYTGGDAHVSSGFTYYNASLSSQIDQLDTYWKYFYVSLNIVNSTLEWIPESPLSEDKKNIREGEVKFLRALFLWHITEIWGEAHFSTSSVKEKQTTANRTPVETFYKQIFEDLEFAEKYIPEDNDNGEYGRVNLWAVRAMLARMHLYRKNYAEAFRYANMLIEDKSEFSLAPSAAELWDIDNTTRTNNKEIIWSTIYSSQGEVLNYAIPETESQDGSYWPSRTGNNLHMDFLMYYQALTLNGGTPVLRSLEYGRAFVRFMPNLFLLDLYHEDIDERFNSTFRSLYLCNNEYSGGPVIGDTAILLSKYVIPKEFKDSKDYLIFDRTVYDTITGEPDGARMNFISLIKFEDPTRNDLQDQFSGRDVFVFRMAEMYLIAAEAKMYTDGAAAAYPYLLDLANNRSYGNDGEALLNSYGVNSSGAGIDIDFILDERAREFAGEFIRFFDLKRTDKLIERVRLHNPDAAPNIQEYHRVRPIPQTQLDAVTNKSEFVQNPGYN